MAVFLLGCALPALAQDAGTGAQRVVTDGIEITFSATPTAPGSDLGTGQDVDIRLTVTDTATGTPLSGLTPAVWLDRPEEGGEAPSCKDRIEAFLQGGLAYRADIDLNSWYILTLNRGGSIAVIDPLLGVGGQQLMALPVLDGVGEDWVLAKNEARLFVTLPKSGEVVVVDTERWKVEARIDVGGKPSRIVLQADGRRAWVVAQDMDAERDGLVVLDVGSLDVVARIPAGQGVRDVALDAGDRYAVAVSPDDGTATVIDAAALASLRTESTGRRPSAVAYSAHSDAFYVSDERDGTVTVLDASGARPTTRLDLDPGLGTIHFSPDGKWGFVADGDDAQVFVLDAATSQIQGTAALDGDPRQILVTDRNAFIRTVGSEQVSVVALELIGAGDITVQQIPAGSALDAQAFASASSMARVPTMDAVLIGNAADRSVYYHMEGMNAPSGGFRNAGQPPLGVLAYYNGLEETEPGTYALTVRFPAGGQYDIPVLIQSPPVWHCFSLSVDAPETSPRDAPWRVAYRISERVVPLGTLNLEFGFEGGTPGQGAQDDVRVLAVQAPGTWQTRLMAEPTDDGYRVQVPIDKEGAYYVFVESPSRGILFGGRPSLILRARAATAEGRAP